MDTPRRRRRWPRVLGVLAALLVIAGVWVNSQLEPRRLAATVLAKAGESLQLKLSFKGTPDYAFRPEPRLVLPGFSAATLDGEVFLSARRAQVSLPWDTITGGEPVITRVQLDAPVLDLPGLRRWMASRPPTPFKLPTLTRGLAVSDGTLRDASWSVQALKLGLPHLRAGDPAKLDASGRFVSGKTDLPFTVNAIAATPGLASPIDLKLQLQLAGDLAKDGKPGAPNPVSIALLGNYAWADPVFTLDATKLALVARSPIPSLEGKGKLEIGETASLGFDAVLSRWPETWPSLPGGLAAKGDKLPVRVSYAGKPDFSDPLTLVAAREDTRVEASLRLTEFQRWLAADASSPLPPLQGKLSTPALDFDGIVLEGVEVEISEGGHAEAAP